MNEEVLFNYYNLFKNLRVVQRATSDINELQYVIEEDFDRNLAIDVCSKMSLKYEAPINRIGSLFSGLKVFRGMKVYREKTDEDILDDLIYIRNCIIIYATVACGLEPSYNTCLIKVTAQ